MRSHIRNYVIDLLLATVLTVLYTGSLLAPSLSGIPLYVYIYLFFFFLTVTLLCRHIYRKYTPCFKIRSLVCIALIGSILITGITLPFFLQSKPTTTSFEITALGQSNQQAQSSEVWILSIFQDGEAVNLNSLENDNWHIIDNALVSYEGQPAVLVFTSYETIQTDIRFGQHGWSGIVTVCSSGDEKVETIDLYNINSDSISYSYRTPTVFPQSVMQIVLLFIALFAFLYFLLSLWDSFPFIISCAIGSLTGFVLFNSSYLGKWDRLSKLLIIIVFGYLFTLLPSVIDAVTIKKLIPSKSKALILIFIVIYATLACTYNQIVISPKEIRFGIEGLCFVLLFFVAITFLSLAFLYLLDKAANWLSHKKKMQKAEGTINRKQKLFIFFLPIFIWGIWLIACFPANMTPDSVTQWAQAIGADPLFNWHPVFYTLLLRLCISIIESPAVAILVQITACAGIWSVCVKYLYKQGVPYKALYLTTFFVAFSPNNGVMLTTLWKDVAYAIAMLALTVSLAKAADTKNFSVNRSIMLILALVFTGLIRHNGIIPVICTVIALIFLFKKWLKLVPVFGLVIIFCLQYSLPILNNVQSSSYSLAMGSPLHGIASVIYYDGTLDSDTLQMATASVPVEVWKSQFNPYIADPLAFSDGPKVFDVLNDASTSDVIKMYVKSFVRNPGTMIHERLANADINWSVFTSAHPLAYISRYGRGLYPNVYVDSSPNFLTPVFNRILGGSSWFQIADIFFWRTGLFIVLIMLLSYSIWSRVSLRYNIAFVPLFANYLFMFLGTNAQDYRYSYLVYLCFPFLLFYCISRNKDRSAKKEI